MKQNGQTDMNWVDSSPRFDVLIKSLFAVCIVACFLLKACHGDIAVLNP